jgi:hypothetical protein
MIRSDTRKAGQRPDSANRATIPTDAERVAAAVARDEVRMAAAAAKKLLTAEDPKAAQISKAAEDPKAAQIPRIAEDPKAAQIPRIAEDPKVMRYNGFDPYNSGSFDRKQAWSKVGKR